MIPTSAQWYSWAARGCPTPQHHDRHGIINFSEISAIFAEIDPIEQTMNSYKNHEFIPPDGVTMTDKSKTRHLVFWREQKTDEISKKNLLGPFSIMVINRFVFVLLLILFFLFSPENAVVRNRVSDHLAKTLRIHFLYL